RKEAASNRVDGAAHAHGAVDLRLGAADPRLVPPVGSGPAGAIEKELPARGPDARVHEGAHELAHGLVVEALPHIAQDEELALGFGYGLGERLGLAAAKRGSDDAHALRVEGDGGEGRA